MDILKFENKKLIEALKIEKRKKNKGKDLNFLDKVFYLYLEHLFIYI